VNSRQTQDVDEIQKQFMEGHKLFIEGPQDAAGRKIPLNLNTKLIRRICLFSERFMPSHGPSFFNPKSFFDTDKSLGL
jgi:hypothetical protein